jgi:hypothetical protein
MGQRIARHLGSLASLPEGMYATDGDCVFFACPRCGGIDEITAEHDIDRGGIVTPLYSCQIVTCSFAEWISLDSYGAIP